jgi:hypothetical protein
MRNYQLSPWKEYFSLQPGWQQPGEVATRFKESIPKRFVHHHGASGHFATEMIDGAKPQRRVDMTATANELQFSGRHNISADARLFFALYRKKNATISQTSHTDCRVPWN